MKEKKNIIKIRNYEAINAWNRHAGPMKGKIYKEQNWEKDWEEELKEIEQEEEKQLNRFERLSENEQEQKQLY